ncbi:MAG: hypothetical protein AABY37_06915 [Actinomycetota bacterium]
MKFFKRYIEITTAISDRAYLSFLHLLARLRSTTKSLLESKFSRKLLESEEGDVPGWVLVVLMTTGLVTAIWTIAAPRLTAILRNSLDSMNGIR